MQERIKEHDRDIWLARTQTSALSDHANKTGHYPLWNEVKSIDLDSHWFTRGVKEAIHIRLHPDNVNRKNGIEFPEAWIPTIKKHDGRPVRQRTAEGTTSNRASQETTSHRNSEDRNAPITADHRDSNGDAQPVNLIAWWRLAVSSRNVATYNSSDDIVRQTIYTFIIVFTTMKNNHLFLRNRYLCFIYFYFAFFVKKCWLGNCAINLE